MTWTVLRVSVTLRGPDVTERKPDPIRPCSRLGVMPGGHLSRLIPEVQMGTRNLAIIDGRQH